MPTKKTTTKKAATRKNPLGRPKIVIDKAQFEKLCGLQCTLIEMACWFNCTEDTIESWCQKEYGMLFSEIFKIKRQTGITSLRRAQFKLAQTNPTMNIWMAKNFLGQKDTIEVENKESLQKLDEILQGIKDNANNPQPETK